MNQIIINIFKILAGFICLVLGAEGLVRGRRSIGLVLLLPALTILTGTMVSAAEIKLLHGDVWQGIKQDEKVALLRGAGQVVVVENEMMAQIPELKVENFSAKVAEGVAKDITVNNLVAHIDSYYHAQKSRKE